MKTLEWGLGGQNYPDVKTTTAGCGWVTNTLNFPDARTIYDGTAPLVVDSVEPTEGTGARYAQYETGGSGWLRTYVHRDVPANAKFNFRVRSESGTITLGFEARSGYVTRGICSGDRVVINKKTPDGMHPGRMHYGIAPSAPRIPVFTVHPTIIGRIDIVVNAPDDDGGFTVSKYLHQVSRNAAFTNIEAEWTSGTGAINHVGLPVGVPLYYRALAKNFVTDQVGKLGGAASATRSFKIGTAPTVAPGLGVSPSSDGASATVGLTPPPGAGLGGLPLKGYRVTREYLAPLPIPTPASETFTIEATGAASQQVLNLIPGASYRWRAVAFNEVGTSPYSAWQTVLQPRNSLSPGQYFDGSFTDTIDYDYAWGAGTPHTTAVSTVSGWVPTGWSASGGGTGAARITRDSASTQGVMVTVLRDCTATLAVGVSGTAYYAAILGGLEYSASADVRTLRGQPMLAEIIWRDAAFAEVSRIQGVTVPVAGGQVETLSVSGMAPESAAYMQVRVSDVAATGWTPWLSGEQFWVGRIIATFGATPIAYFDGSTPAGNGFTYRWEGATNLSRSIREGTYVPPNPLIDPDCVMPPAPPRPPVVPSECIEPIVDWDRYWYEIPENEISLWTSILPQIMVRTNVSAERQIRVRVYADPFGRGLAALPLDAFCGEMVISFLPPDAELVLDSLTERAWAQVAGSPTQSAAHLLYGSDGRPAQFPEMSCGVRHYVTVDVPVGSVFGNVSVDVLMQGKF